MTEPPDPFWLAEQIVAGEHVNGWSVAARMLAEALLVERARGAADRELWRRRIEYLDDLNERARAEMEAIPVREAALEDEVAVWKSRFDEVACRMADMKTRAAAFSDRVVDTPKGLVLEYGSRDVLAALREVL